MTTTHPQQQPSPNRKNYAAVTTKKSAVGIVGFVLSCASILSFGLTAIPGVILCIVGLIRKGHRVLSSFGLIICLFGLILFSTWTAPGTIPYPFSIAKYCVNSPRFWGGYDLHNLREAQSQYMLFGGAIGALYFKAESSKAFEEEAIIAFASKHGWDFVNRVQFGEKDFQELLNGKNQVKRLDYEACYNSHIRDYDEEEEAIQAFEALWKKREFLDNVTVASQFPWWIKQDCTILSFDTGNRASLSSHVVMSEDGTEMAVYYNGVR